jgi:hypothetical protein
MFLRLKAFEAFDIYEFKDPDTGFLFKAAKLSDLYKDIILYREQNNLERLEGLNHVVENYLCGLPRNCNKCQENILDRSFWAYVRGGIALLKNMTFKEYVPQYVAEKRALQCSGCRFNVFPDKDNFMKWTDEIAVSCVGDRKVSIADKLGNCEVCSCVLKSKCFFGGKLEKFNDEQLVKLQSVNCWQLESSGQK